MIQDNRYQQAKKVTLIGAISNMFLGMMKMVGGYLLDSHALSADGLHSLADLLTDGMVLFASKYGSLDADDSHPYGHRRIETAATLVLSLLLILAGLAISWDSLYELVQATYVKPMWLSLPIIAASILGNEALFHYTWRVGKRIHSKLITANAWHHRSDAASSLVVLLGLIGSLAGFSFFDALAAIVVGLMIIKMGWDYGWNSLKELVDTAVSSELLVEMHTLIKRIDGVEKLHQLRTRSMGDKILIDVHILVSPKISVSEGHHIAQEVHHTLMKQVAHVQDVMVHVDPEDDELSSPSLDLPNRKAVAEKLLHQVQIDFPQILFWNLHYLDGKIGMDLICDEYFTQWQELHHRVILALTQEVDVEEVRLFSLHPISHHH